MLMRIDSKYFVKADNTAIALMDSSFAEAVEFLFMVFFVFAVDYPYILCLFYGFLERSLKIDSSMKSSEQPTVILNDRQIFGGRSQQIGLAYGVNYKALDIRR